MIATQQVENIKHNPFLNVAVNIAKYLAKEAIWSDQGSCNWQGKALEALGNENVIVNRTFKSDIYTGLSGIALFLAEIQLKENDPILQATLTGAVKTILLQCENSPLACKFGLYAGQLGVGFALWRIGILNDNPQWQQQGLNIIRKLKDHEINENEIDVITGAAGAIPALLKIYQAEQENIFLEIAIKCGQFLIKTADKKNDCWIWKGLFPDGLTGFSHGNSGIALALLALYHNTKDQQYYQAAVMGFAFEDKHFLPQQNNWPDLREPVNNETNARICGNMWCHGAPGIALSRLRAYQITSQDGHLQQAHTALQTTYNHLLNQLKNPQLDNFSLCHGLAGNADILLSASLLLKDNNYFNIAQQVGLIGIELYEKTGTMWPSGVNDPSGMTSGGEETPGLMLGLAGTGLFYLRLAFPTEINSVLLID